MAEILVYEKLIKPAENGIWHLCQLFTQKESPRINYALCYILMSFSLKCTLLWKLNKDYSNKNANRCFFFKEKEGERLKLVNWLYIYIQRGVNRTLFIIQFMYILQRKHYMWNHVLALGQHCLWHFSPLGLLLQFNGKEIVIYFSSSFLKAILDPL